MLLCSNELFVVQSSQSRRFAAASDCRTIAIYQYTPLETNFDEFSACPDAEAVFGGVIGVAVIVAPRDILLMIAIANDRPRDQNDGCADDESPSYQLCHFTIISPTIPTTRRRLIIQDPAPKCELVHTPRRFVQKTS